MVKLRISLLILLSSLCFVQSKYLVSTPRQWVAGSTQRVCILLTEDAAAGDTLSIEGGLIPPYYAKNQTVQTVIKTDVIIDGAAKTQQCQEINTPNVKENRDFRFRIYGTLNGKDMFHEVNGSIEGTEGQLSSYISTDKYLYKPGQQVNIRLLSLFGPTLKLYTKPYDLIFVKSPSDARISQWRDVANENGLVHLDFNLADEPEYGLYQIKVSMNDRIITTYNFKVDEYNLPRFEVTMNTEESVTNNEEFFKVKVCANYTFGEGVKGMLNVSVSNGAWGSCRNNLNVYTPISGCKEVEFETLKLRFRNPHCHVYSLNINAAVIENGTDTKLNAEGKSIRVRDNLIEFKDLSPPGKQKPGIPFFGKVEVKYVKGNPAANEPFELCYDLPRVHSVRGKGDKCKNVTSNREGIIEFILPTYSLFSIRSHLHKEVKSTIEEDYVILHERDFNSYSANKYHSPTNSSLHIKPQPEIKCLKDGSAKVENLQVMFHSNNQKSANIFIQVLSRGNIQESSNHDVSMADGSFNIDEGLLVEPIPKHESTNYSRGEFSVPVQINNFISPEAHILIGYVRDDGEVVVDSITLDIEECLNYDVSMDWTKPKVEPGETSTMKIQATPQSLCSVGIVDKSVDLISDGNQQKLSISKIFQALRKFEISKWKHSMKNDNKYCEEVYEREQNLTRSNEEKETSPPSKIIRPIHVYYATEDEDSFITLNDFGLFALSDLQLEHRNCIERSYSIQFRPAVRVGAGGFGGASGAGKPFMAFDSDSDLGLRISNDHASVTPDDAVRTYFPETWLWDLELVGADGTFSKEYKLPDTITEWVGHSVCVNKDQGVGLSKSASITTFTPFFIDLTMPPIVTRGEIIPVKISVFNYVEADLPVQMTLSISEDYDILVDNSTEVQSTPSAHFACISKNEKEVFTVRVRPKIIGNMNLTVSAEVDETASATCSNAGKVTKRDAIIKPMKVEPEGFPKERTFNNFICSNDKDPSAILEIDIPSITVEGSDRAWVDVTGDLFTQTLKNLGRLIRMPYGCGEQNLVNFAPNIFIMNYLNHTDQLTPELEYKLRRYMVNGYQRQMRYRHRYGGFSVFGNSDSSGSTYLTAFVVKSFAQARKYMDIDENVIQKSVEFMVKKQDKEGCFDLAGKVLHKGMLGGLSLSRRDYLHTAYILIALLEGNANVTSNITEAALRCLKEGEYRNFYGHSLKAYALALADDPEAITVLDEMLKNATETSTNMHWPIKSLGAKSDSVEVETAAYIVLALMRADPVKYKDHAWKVIRWILTMRNANGGFVSTQDTVVGLQAVATFSTHLPKQPLAASMNIEYQDVVDTVSVNDLNRKLQQRTKIPNLPTNVSLSLDPDSNGCIISQGVLRYNSPYPDQSKSFVLKVTTETSDDRSCKMKTIRACGAYRNKNDANSNMALLEIQLVTGYTPVKEDLKREAGSFNSLFKRYEVDGRTVTFYADSFGQDFKCAEFRVKRTTNVEDPQPGIVKLLDYYEPDLYVSEELVLPNPEHCNFKQMLRNEDALLVTHTCWRRRWQRPQENSDPESTLKVPIGTTLSTWCLPEEDFSDLVRKSVDLPPPIPIFRPIPIDLPPPGGRPVSGFNG